jgi:hypothetical protein
MGFGILVRFIMAIQRIYTYDPTLSNIADMNDETE